MGVQSRDGLNHQVRAVSLRDDPRACRDFARFFGVLKNVRNAGERVLLGWAHGFSATRLEPFEQFASRGVRDDLHRPHAVRVIREGEHDLSH